jgi:phosphoribosylamine--glycine ligase
LYIAPGNGGTGDCGENVSLVIDDFAAIAAFCLEKGVEMIVPASEAPLVAGIYDYFLADERLSSIAVIGPSKAAAQLEGSKAFAKAFMERNAIPTAGYREFTVAELEEGKRYLEGQALPIVLKADGLAAGKGVVICASVEEAKQEMEEMLASAKFGAAGSKVVVEDFLTGIECSVFVLTDGEHYRLLPTAKDYKRIGEGDTGLNTGGMGAVSPVPFADAVFMEKVERTIILPTIAGLRKEDLVYKGFIYFGLMKVGDTPYVIEYNCRMGDPETEAVLPRITSDLVTEFEKVAAGSLETKPLEVCAEGAVTIVLASKGYPEAFEKEKEIKLPTIPAGGFVFHAGTKLKDGKLVSSGGRVLMLTSLDKDLREALRKSNALAQMVDFENKYYRRDIGLDLGLGEG